MQQTANDFIAEFRPLGRGLAEALTGAHRQAAARLSPAELERWASAAREVRVAAGAPYSALAAYVAASEAALTALGLARFIDWAGLGRGLLVESDALGAAFFTATPATLSHLPPVGLRTWAH